MMEFLSTATKFVIDSFHSSLYNPVSISIFIVLLVSLGYNLVRDTGLPPGPTGIPFLGYWPFLKRDILHLQQIALKKKYGDVFSYRVTGKLFINLASRKALREAHITKADSFMERTSDFNILRQIFGEAVFFSNGEKWRTVRKFFLNQFRERGMSIYKENTAEAINGMMISYIDELRKNEDKPIDILRILIKKVNDVIQQTFLGPNTPFTESDIYNLQKNYESIATLLHSSNLLLTGNIAKYLLVPFLPFYREGIKIHKVTVNTILRIIDDHKKTFDSHNIRDVIDSFIDEKNQRLLKRDPTAMHFTDETLANNILQFVADGALNVATFITFTLKALLEYPEEQEKIYKELVDVCGEDRNPCFADRSRLTYTNAFLLEAQRLSNFVPLIPNLECTKETIVGGYRIPKGAITISNVSAIHMDPKEYSEPERFNPLRFISIDGKPKEESPITFGMGKRVCLGESFALMQIFLFTAVTVKNFKISYYHLETQHDIKRNRALKIKVVPRKK